MVEDVGRVLAARYRLSELLGQGGMGAVWRAYDEQLKREVAVKELRLPEGFTDAERESWIARLDREASAAARLKHPGIITVHDRVTGDDGRPWIVMELVHGRSLDDLIRTNGPLPADRVADIGLQILDALRTAHQAGITHRDIKPANVLLEGDRVVLTDFGIARVDGEAALTRSGALIGTPSFMSPEQVRGLPATAESDLWSLGATLFTALEGHPPFGGASPGAVMVAIATEDPAAHAGPLAPAISGLLHKDPAERLRADQLHVLLTRRPMPQHQVPVPPPQPGFPQYRQPPMAGGPGPWGDGPRPLAATPRPGAYGAAAVIAGILALLTAGMLVWFALYNVVYASGAGGRWSSLVVENVLGGFISAGVLLVAAGFTVARSIPGAWTLCALCVFYAVATIFLGPLQGSTTLGAQLTFVFGFGKSNGIAVGLSIIFGVLTAIMAAIAGSVKSYGPTTATPHRS
ncbi:serine/threonine protein kinase [Actinomadura barringtoniae]|uniref:non-specific serine/threonine protein kinase n=1 Tax=Actinomadura barringtoniae TaxID=1427535 RepID=A0A939P8T7_9ACTN|nr:serine/threonine-protein kinase [Actinomadura barringtoniae]MBO2447915.1 serine/threonine protein kinase [Actinomadura barringtoniae]